MIQLPLFAAMASSTTGYRMPGFVDAARRVFDTPAPSRRAGPDTSREAARALDSAVGRLRMDALRHVVNAGDGGSTFDSWRAARGHQSSQSGRFSELADAGLIEATDRRRPTVAGHMARVFVATQAGREAAR